MMGAAKRVQLARRHQICRRIADTAAAIARTIEIAVDDLREESLGPVRMGHIRIHFLDIPPDNRAAALGTAL